MSCEIKHMCYITLLRNVNNNETISMSFIQ